MFAIEIENLNHSINNKEILKNISFKLNKENVACVLGPSGSGKTTLLKLIAGLERVQSGFIKINDFIEAKDRFIKRDFPGISYISCPSDFSDDISNEYEDYHICSLHPPDFLDEH